MLSEDRAKLLITQAKQGDRAAFDELAAEHRAHLLSFIGTRLGPQLRQRVEPDDVLQDALLRAFESIARFQWRGPGCLFSWFASIAEFRIRDLMRAMRRRPEIPLEIEPVGNNVSPSKHVRREERFGRLNHAVAALSDDHRTVIHLALIEKLPVCEIADRMQRTPSAVRHLLLRAIEKLRGLFGPETESLHLPSWGFVDGGWRSDA